MLDDKLFERFKKPDFALALHCDHTLATGQVSCRGGYMLANVDSVDITVKGKGGHGAYPHTTIDPIVQAAQLVLALQTVVSREIKPLEPCVITVGSIHGGSKHNIIGDDCHLQLTVRSYSDETRQALKDGIIRKAKGIAVSCGAPEPKIEFSEGTPALFNDEKLNTRMVNVFRRELGEATWQLASSRWGARFQRIRPRGCADLHVSARLGQRQATRAVQRTGAKSRRRCTRRCTTLTWRKRCRSPCKRCRPPFWNCWGPEVTRADAGWLTLYVVLVALIAGSVFAFRRGSSQPMLAASDCRMGRVARRCDGTLEASRPVKRKPPKTAEPPGLILMRESLPGRPRRRHGAFRRPPRRDHAALARRSEAVAVCRPLKGNEAASLSRRVVNRDSRCDPLGR